MSSAALPHGGGIGLQGSIKTEKIHQIVSEMNRNGIFSINF
jgi:hypothetical protein